MRAFSFRGVRRGTARMAAGLGLALGLGACALPWGPDGDGPAGGSDAWVDYLGGVDLRSACADGEPDRFRLVYQESAQADVHILDMTANPAGGAQLRHHRLEPVDLAAGGPDGRWRDGGERLELTPDGLAGLMGGLDRLGVFTPSPGPPAASGGALSWLISGCLDGAWFLNLYLPPPGDGAVEVKAGPAFSARAPLWPPAGAAARSGSGRRAPAASPMASLADPATVR